MLKTILTEILGILVIIFGILDGIKYYWFAKKIQEVKSSRAYSRKGLNVAIFNDVIRILYGLCIHDWFIILSGMFASVTMMYCWWEIYLYYPYRHYPKEKTIRLIRPNIFVYIWNSILPNRFRPKL